MHNIKLDKWIVPIGVFLCGVVLVPQARDPGAMPRYIIWCLIVLLSVGFLRVGKIHIFALAYLGFTALSYFNAVNKSEWLFATLVAALSILYLSVHIDKDLLVKSMILLGAVLAIWFWAEAYYTDAYYTDASKASSLLSKGPMRQENLFSAACFFMIPFCLYALKEGFWKKISYIVIIAMLLNILLLQAKSVYLATFIVFIPYLYCKSYTKAPILFVAASIIGLSVLIAIVFIWPVDWLLEHPSMRMRTHFWSVTADMIRPTGAGNWLIEYPHYAQNIDWSWVDGIKNPMNLVPKHPHNDFLWIWAEIGIFGLLSYLCMLGYALWSARKKTYLLIGIVGYMIISCFSGLRERPFALLILFTYIAMACERTIPVRRTDLITTVLVFAIVVFGFRLRASIYNKDLQKGKWSQVIEKTAGYSVFSTLSHCGVPWHWWSGMYYEKTGNRELAIMNFRRAYKYNPYSIHVLGGMGKVAILERRKDTAKMYFKKVLKIHPENKEAKGYLRILK